MHVFRSNLRQRQWSCKSTSTFAVSASFRIHISSCASYPQERIKWHHQHATAVIATTCRIAVSAATNHDWQPLLYGNPNKDWLGGRLLVQIHGRFNLTRVKNLFKTFDKFRIFILMLFSYKITYFNHSFISFLSTTCHFFSVPILNHFIL